MEAAIQLNQMDVDKDKAKPDPEVASLPQERHIWRMPEFPSFPKKFITANTRIAEDHRDLRRLEPIVLQRKGQKDKELAEKSKSFIHRPEEGVGNDPSFGERRPSGVYQLQTSSISVQGQAQKTSEGTEKSQEQSRQRQRQSRLAQTLPTRVEDPQIGTFSSGQCLQYGQNSYGIHSQGAGKDEQDFSTQIIQEIQFVKTSINVEIGKIDSKLTKIQLVINDLKKNDRHYSEWYKSIIAKLDSITNTCDRIGRENAISARGIPRLEDSPTFSGEGEYNHIKLIRTIDMFQEYFHIPDEIIVGKLHSLFTTTAKKWCYKMRQDHGKNDWPWWKSEIFTKWANSYWRFKMENSFESAILNSEKDKPLTWFLKQKDRLSALHPDMSGSMINMKILRKCGGELEHAIKCRCIEPCSTEDYIYAMEDIITRTRICKTWTKNPMESRMTQRISREDKKPERKVLKCHKCGSTSNLANDCTKRLKSRKFKSLKRFIILKRKENLTMILQSLKIHQ
ncbi:hypothetical protein O181_104248 [Austropuccinia psidii MF-1]|uniref:Uncharacterized protein n=1 Tax=Austropuccinia psidii MF-1 TaxID=1389203 RepID=A0A9Q3JJS4_9BASI|nr:hypothetical protein [Austropuccinia psidii MF-1]